MTRRRLLRSILSIAAMAMAGPAGRAAAVPPSTIARNVREILVDAEGAAAIGRVHLAAATVKPDFATVVRQLAVDGVPLEAPDFLPASLRHRFDARVRQDFADGRITVVDGWHMSQTEVRLCTLAAML